VTIFALLSFWIIPESKWLRRAQVQAAFAEADATPIHDKPEEDSPTGTGHAADHKPETIVAE
jgi:hypothetical protein